MHTSARHCYILNAVLLASSATLASCPALRGADRIGDLQQMVSQLADAKPDAWPKALDRVLFALGFLREAQLADDKTQEAFQRALSVVVAFSRRQDLDVVATLPMQEAIGRENIDHAVAAALHSPDMKKPYPETMEVKYSRPFLMEDTAHFFHALPTPYRAKAKPALLDFMRNLSASDVLARNAAASIAAIYELSTKDVQPIFSKWIEEVPAAPYVHTINSEFPDPELKKKIVSATIARAKSVTALTRDQLHLLGRMDVPKELVPQLAQIALDDLSAFDAESNPLAWALASIVLGIPSWTLTQEQAERIEREIHNAAGAKRAILLMLLLRSPDRKEVERFLRTDTSKIISDMARWDYLPVLKSSETREGRREARVILCVHDMLLLALVPDLKLTPDAVASLKAGCSAAIGEFDKGAVLNSKGKHIVNRFAVFSILWRFSGDPVQAVSDTWIGKMAAWGAAP